MKREKNIFVGFFTKKNQIKLNVRDTITILKNNYYKIKRK